jgi:uncharacterized protein YkvS
MIQEDNFRDLGFTVLNHKDSLSGYDWNEYTLLKTNVAYTVQEISSQRDMYSVHIGSIINFVRNLTPGDLIFRGRIKTVEELKVLLVQLGVLNE